MMFLDNVIDDPFMIVHLIVKWTLEFLISGCRYLSLCFLQFYHEHIVLLCHLLAQNLNLLECLLELCLDFDISCFQLFETAVVRIISNGEQSAVTALNLNLRAVIFVMLLPLWSRENTTTTKGARHLDS